MSADLERRARYMNLLGRAQGLIGSGIDMGLIEAPDWFMADLRNWLADAKRSGESNDRNAKRLEDGAQGIVREGA